MRMNAVQYSINPVNVIMSGAPLQPAKLAFVDDVPYAEAFGDIYHSAHGGLGQARHVFLGGSRLPTRWHKLPRFVIFEAGFGLGLNFLATWSAWRDDPERPRQLHYIAVEKHPFSATDLARLHAAWPELAALSDELQQAWPPLTPGFHRILLDEGRVSLTLAFGDIGDCLPQIDASVNAIYLDGFAPDKNPDMWSPAMLKRLARIAAPAASVATYSVAADVRNALESVGFVCGRQAGFGRKGEMLVGRYAPRWQAPPPRSAAAVREAIVIGAGLAGSAACERLAARGWRVHLLERHAQPAQEASGNLAGILKPLLSRDDNPGSQLARAAYLFALRHWQRLERAGLSVIGEARGVLQLAADEADAQAQATAAAALRYPEGYAQWLDGERARIYLAGESSHGGWFFPQGGWVRPASFCAAMLAACGHANGGRIEKRFGTDAMSLMRAGDRWQVRDAHGGTIAEAPVVILANGTSATQFSQTHGLPLSAVRGQVTHLDAALLPPLSVTVSGNGYLTPSYAGISCIGASYDFDGDPQLRCDSQQGNLARLAELLPQAAQAAGADLQAAPLAGRVGFRCVTPDRLPLVGALPDLSRAIAGSRPRDVPRLPGLYGLLGYGSRGLIWAPFAAELLASWLDGEPLPIERDLANALDPARFALKAHRRGTA